MITFEIILGFSITSCWFDNFVFICTNRKREPVRKTVEISIHILPLLDSIRENMYEISTVLRTGSLFRLVQIKTKLSNQQLVIEKPKIISNVIKGKK